MDTQKFYEQFQAFLLDVDEPRTTPESARSYASYLRGANRHFSPLKDKNADYFAYVADLPNETRSKLVGEFLAKLQAEQHNPSSNPCKKTLGNYCSALRALEDFYQSSDLPFIPLPPTTPKSNNPSIRIVYTAAQIRRSFRSRLKTQDRFYDFGSFPCRLLGKVFHRNKEYFSLYEGLIDNAKLLLGNGGLASLREVRGIVIKDGFAYALIGNDEKPKPIYTQAFENGRSQGIKPMEASALSSLSLDHDQSLYDTLKDKLDKMPTLKRLGEDIVSYRQGRSFPNASAFTKEYYAKAYPALGIDRASLLKELKDFFSCLSLTLMNNRDNSSKNKGRPDSFPASGD